MVWRSLRGAVTAIDGREPIVARIERRDGMMIDMTTMPLPDGATLVTFQDISDTVNVERALLERNEALVAADGIKIDFVPVSYTHLKAKLASKGCDWILANDVSPRTGIMGGDRNTIQFITTKSVEPWPPQSKQDVAAMLIARIAQELKS